MKLIPNIITTIPNGKSEAGEQKFLNYADLIKVVTNQPVQGGYSVFDMSMRLSLQGSCVDAKETIEIEDERFKYLQGIVKTSKWNILHADIEQFTKNIESFK